MLVLGIDESLLQKCGVEPVSECLDGTVGIEREVTFWVSAFFAVMWVTPWTWILNLVLILVIGSILWFPILFLVLPDNAFSENDDPSTNF